MTGPSRRPRDGGSGSASGRRGAGAQADTGLFDSRLEGSVERIVFESDDGSWAVVQLRLRDGVMAPVVGNLAPVFEGEDLVVDGCWEHDARFGDQFRATAVRVARPRDTNAVQRYLASGAVPGVGPALAQRIVERFGAEVLQIFDEQPRRLLEIPGIGPKRLAGIRKIWQERAAERGARIFLQERGVGPVLSERIVRLYGDSTEDEVREDPYRLAVEIRGVGFRTADAIARSLGWEETDPARVRAGLRFALEKAIEDGHCFLPWAGLIHKAAPLLEIDPDIVDTVLRATAESGDVVAEDDVPVDDTPVYLPWLRDAERRVARRLRAIHEAPAALDSPGSGAEAVTVDPAGWVEARVGVSLGRDQRDAVNAAVREKVLVVTGGPGTGKTTLIDAVVRCSAAAGRRVALAAPTGRAAKRLEQATGNPARTLHRLLEYNVARGFMRGPARPLDVDIVVVDEVSMVDLPLMDALLAAVRPTCRLLLVGDADQLPPVGPGAVLRDLLNADVLPAVCLTEIYRQARRSLIVRNAHRVNRGEVPVGAGEPETQGADPDFYFLEQDDPARARDVVVELVTRRIPSRFGLDPHRDIQVLVPMHRGRCGVSRLNQELQAVLNPRGRSLTIGDTEFREGDRVMQLRNDYDRDVYNGDVGRLARIGESGGMVVRFAGREVEYDRKSLDGLALAYAISIHKSQGSEYPGVVSLLMPEHHVMLQRNLLYTAITRARSVAVLIGTRATVARAVRNASPAQRFTRLADLLCQQHG